MPLNAVLSSVSCWFVTLESAARDITSCAVPTGKFRSFSLPEACDDIPRRFILRGSFK